MASIDIKTIEAIAGRPLGDVERDNFDLYIKIVYAAVKDLICLDLSTVDEIPPAMIPVVADMFLAIRAKGEAAQRRGVSSKKVEDFQVNYSTDQSDPMAEAIANNRQTLATYSQCSTFVIRHGRHIPVVNSNDWRGYDGF